MENAGLGDTEAARLEKKDLQVHKCVRMTKRYPKGETVSETGQEVTKDHPEGTLEVPAGQREILEMEALLGTQEGPREMLSSIGNVEGSLIREMDLIGEMRGTGEMEVEVEGRGAEGWTRGIWRGVTRTIRDPEDDIRGIEAWMSMQHQAFQGQGRCIGAFSGFGAISTRRFD